jgi:hypothetical protein
MSFSKMVSDFVDLLKKEGSGVATVDMQNHANSFATAIDNYVKELYDPGKRKVKSTTKLLMIPPILAIASSPGTGTASVDAQKSALQYATAIQLYALAIVIDSGPVTLPLGGILTPPGNPIIATLTAPTILTSIQNDFKNIFTEDTPEGVSLDVLVLLKAQKFSNAIKKAFTTTTVVTISGQDSTLPPPAGIGPQSFSITGPLSEN